MDLCLSEMGINVKWNTVSCTIWTRVADSISYDDNVVMLRAPIFDQIWRRRSPKFPLLLSETLQKLVRSSLSYVLLGSEKQSFDYNSQVLKRYILPVTVTVV